MKLFLKNKREDNGKLFRYNLFPKNHRGGGKYLSPYWMLVLILILGGIYWMINIFYGAPYDVRKIESRILMNQVADCISYNGTINPEIISQGVALKEGVFAENCHFNFELEKDEYYVNVEIYKLANLDSPFVEITNGNNNLLAECNIQSQEDYASLAQCSKGDVYSVDDVKNQYIIKILTAVRKIEQNAKT